MPQVSRICTQIVLMDKGQVKYQGTNVSEGIDQYYSQFKTENSDAFHGGGVAVSSIFLNDVLIDTKNKSIQVDRLSELAIKINLNIDVNVEFPEISLGFFDKEMRVVANFIRERSVDRLENKNGKLIKGTNKDLGGTMRLGLYEAKLRHNSLIEKIYKSKSILERHRHRYEVNNNLKNKFENKGMIFSGMSPDGKLPEIIELKNHPWFIGVQFHPEFKSRPLSPHPLFSSFIKAAKNHQK
mgnify:CR=1 FL=1